MINIDLNETSYMFTNAEYDAEYNIEIYNYFIAFVEEVFEKRVSFFNKEIELFNNSEVFDEYEKRFIVGYDNTKKKGSQDKYAQQLIGASEKVRHFFANVLWLYEFPLNDKSRESKIEELLLYLDDQTIEETVASRVPKEGLLDYGVLKRKKYININFVYFFIKEYMLKRRNPNEIIKNLDVSALMTQIHSDHGEKNVWNVAPRHILNFLFNPRCYEPIASTSDKNKICEHFSLECDENNLDEVIYQYRLNTFGFEKSLRSEIDKKVSYVSLSRVIKSKSYKTQFTDQNEENDLEKRYQTRLQNGATAELIVAEAVENEIKEQKNGLASFVNEIVKLNPELGHAEVVHDIRKYIHYSKNFHTFAPFDILSFRDKQMLFIEVKSMTGNQIYFSSSEIKFAYQNIEQYEVRVVKDGEIFVLDLSEDIEYLYEYIFEENKLWQADTIKFSLEL